MEKKLGTYALSVHGGDLVIFFNSDRFRVESWNLLQRRSLLIPACVPNFSLLATSIQEMPIKLLPLIPEVYSQIWIVEFALRTSRVLTKNWSKLKFKSTKFPRESEMNQISRMSGFHFMNEKLRFFAKKCGFSKLQPHCGTGYHISN